MDGSLTLPDLIIGTTIECFHAVGKIPVTIDVFIMQVKYGTIIGRESFRYLSRMPSEPLESVFFICAMVRVIVCQSVGLGRNR